MNKKGLIARQTIALYMYLSSHTILRSSLRIQRELKAYQKKTVSQICASNIGDIFISRISLLVQSCETGPLIAFF